MRRLRIIDARKMEKLLLTLGFERVRQKGSRLAKISGSLSQEIIRAERA